MADRGSNNRKQNRPESGGAELQDAREQSGLLEREKREFAESQKAKVKQTKEQTEQQAADGPDEPNPESGGR